MTTYKPGDAVRYRGQKCTVLEGPWFDGEYYRYYVNCKGVFYSVPQWKLQTWETQTASKKAEQNQPPKNAKLPRLALVPVSYAQGLAGGIAPHKPDNGDDAA